MVSMSEETANVMRVAGNVYWTGPSSNIGTFVGDIIGSFSFTGVLELNQRIEEPRTIWP
jgi:hypothetical protein